MRPFKIAIVGPESTGKSDLAAALASHFNTAYVPEVARDYLNHLNRPYTYDDLFSIAKKQIETEDQLSLSNELLICDTTLLVIKIWSEVKYQKADAWIAEEERNRNYDLYLLTNIDLPWQADPLREHPHQREYLFNLYHRALIDKKVLYEIVTGQGNLRSQRAISYINLYRQRILKDL